MKGKTSTEQGAKSYHTPRTWTGPVVLTLRKCSGAGAPGGHIARGGQWRHRSERREALKRELSGNLGLARRDARDRPRGPSTLNSDIDIKIMFHKVDSP